MEIKHVYDVVTSMVSFPHGMSVVDWSSCFCAVCGDGDHSKGPRGGWKFEGDMAFYNCFNCAIKGNFDPDRQYPFSKDMWQIFEAFGVEKSTLAQMVRKKDGELKKPERRIIPVTQMDIPSHFYPLSEASLSDSVALKARTMLRERYRLTQDDYPFYLSTGSTAGLPHDKWKHTKLLGRRIIIPFFKNGKMVFYQARSMYDDDTAPKYVNPDIPKTNILFNMDALYKDIDRPLFVFEGAFDAIHVNGVATMQNDLSSNQLELLNRSPRTKIIVPDRLSDSRKLLDIGLENGWGVSLPEIGKSCKDISEGICKYGKLHVINSMVQKSYFGREAKVLSAKIGNEKPKNGVK